MEQLKVILDPTDTEQVFEHLTDKELVAFDSETTGVHVGCEVVGISICAEMDLAYYIVYAYWDVEKQELVYIPGMREVMLRLLQVLTTKQLVAHNGVFDCAVIDRYFGVRVIESLHTCTLILAHLLNENRKIGLKELAKEAYGEDSTNESKEMKASVIANGGIWQDGKDGVKEMYKASPLILGKYGAKDALLTFKLFFDLVDELFTVGLDKFFYEEESMPLLRTATYDLNTQGLRVDAQALAALKQTLQGEIAEAKAYIYSEIDSLVKEKYPGTTKKNGFNIGASQQMSWLLFGKLELEFGTLTKGGKAVCKAMGLKLPYALGAKRQFIAECLRREGQVYQPGYFNHVTGKTVKDKKIGAPWKYIACDKKTLTKLAPRYKWIETLLGYQKKTKLLTTYVEGIQERLNYGVIYPSFLQHGTTSGRYSSRNPNFQNLPRDDKRIKNCIIARPGKTFVGADFSQLEVRVFASVSQDPSLLAAFKTGEDFYSVIGMRTFDKSDCTAYKDGSPDAFGVKYKKLRDAAKVLALATTYGATAHQLASGLGKSIDDTQADIDRYFEEFPKVRDMMNTAHAKVKNTGVTSSLYGRLRRLPDAKKINQIYGKKEHGELPYEARKLLNLSVNHMIQSTGASICNRALVAFYRLQEEAGLKRSPVVLQVHDEIVIECDTEIAEDIAAILQYAMENTVELPGVSLEAIPAIADKIGGLK